MAVKKYWGAIKFIEKPCFLAKREAIRQNTEAIMYLNEYDEDQLKVFLKDNINILKYLYETVDIDLVVELLKEKVAEEHIEHGYVKDYLELEILEMDKLNFIREFGSKEAKKALIDYKLSI